MMCRGLSSAYDPSDEYISDVALANQNIVENMPVMRLGMHPSSCMLVAKLEDCVHDSELMVTVSC